MLTLTQLYKLLAMNTSLLQVETALKDRCSFQRLTELQLHRAIVKDMIIESLNQNQGVSNEAIY